MTYYFICDNCGNLEDFNRPIKEGPPQYVQCINCGQQMRHEMGGNFILKGWFPGKSLKESEHKAGIAREKSEDEISEHNRHQRIADEVIKVRRKGKGAIRQYKKDNPDKYKEYVKGLGKNIRGK